MPEQKPDAVTLFLATLKCVQLAYEARAKRAAASKVAIEVAPMMPFMLYRNAKDPKAPRA